MATFDYGRSKATAARLIKRYGQAGAIRRTTMTGGDPWNPTPETNDYDCTLVVIEYSAFERQGSTIGATDKRVLISTEGVTIPAYDDDPDSANAPTERDQIVVGAKVHEVVRVDPLNPGGTVVMWDAQVTF